MKLSAQLTNINTSLLRLTDFVERLGDTPESDIFSISTSTSGDASAIVMFLGQFNRDKALSYIGDVLGREGWTKTLNNYGCYSWNKTFLGVNVQLYQVERVGMPLALPVNPKEFPLQLTDIITESK